MRLDVQDQNRQRPWRRRHINSSRTSTAPSGPRSVTSCERVPEMLGVSIPTCHSCHMSPCDCQAHVLASCVADTRFTGKSVPLGVSPQEHEPSEDARPRGKQHRRVTPRRSCHRAGVLSCPARAAHTDPPGQVHRVGPCAELTTPPGTVPAGLTFHSSLLQ